MYNVASSSASLATFFTDSGTIIAVVIAAVLAGLVALMGLGFGVRHVKKYITGRKF